MSQKKYKIQYDATFQILAPHRGMALYISQFIEALSTENREITGIAPTGTLAAEGKTVKSFGFKNILLWEQFSINKNLKENVPDVFIFPYNTGPVFFRPKTKYILILHDLIFMEPLNKIPFSKNLRQIIGRLYRYLVVPKMIRKAHHIITVSEESKRKIIKKFGKKNNISVIPNSIDISDKSLNPPWHEREYFLNVGGDAPHKNTAFLIHGYSNLNAAIKEKFPLKIVGISNVGSRRHYNNLIRSLNEQNNIILEPYLDKEELVKLYQKAKLFVFPSLLEGFGIPLLEAMKYGCTILCSNVNSMYEVCGNAAYYFDPLSLEDFKEKVLEAINNVNEVPDMVSKAAKRLENYSKENFVKKVEKWTYEYLT